MFWRIILVSVALSIFCGISLGQQKPVNCKVQDKEIKVPKYRVGRFWYTVKDPSVLVLQISVDAKHINRDDMISLAKKIKQDYCKEKRLNAIIFTNHKAARDFVFSRESPTLERDLKEMRGGYFLNRDTGEEYVSFSPDPNKPREEMKIDLKDESK
jgi:hypothetical protein